MPYRINSIMSKVIQRLLVFFIGIPVVITLVWLPYYNHLAMHLLALCASVFAANELHAMLGAKYGVQPKPLVLVLDAALPIMGLLCALFGWDLRYIDFTFIAAVLILLAFETISAQTFEQSNARIITSVFIIMYCGFFFSFVSKMTLFPNATAYIAFFLLFVFMCDSLAWFFGVLFGKNNKGFIKASPNKSIAGFCGGIAGSVCVGLIGHYVLPKYCDIVIFDGAVWKAALLGVLMGLSAIIGDLTESVLKRSAEVKDSGNMIPGRGGMLDCVDSIVFSAPIYYWIISLLYLGTTKPAF